MKIIIALTAVIAVAVTASVLIVLERHKTDSPKPVAKPQIVAAQPQPVAQAPSQNPLVLSLPVSAGRMTLTFATWKDMQAAEARFAAAK